MQPSRRGLAGLLASAATTIATRAPAARLEGRANLRDFAAAGDGRADETAALLAAAASGLELDIAAGRYRVSRDVTFRAPVNFAYGAVLQSADDITLAFDGGLAAGVQQIFVLTGRARVTIDRRFLQTGRPEWWGAVTDDPAFDCQPAIQACIDACPVTALQAADYHTRSAIRIAIHNRVLEGVGSNQNGAPGGSRIVLGSATADGLRVGFDQPPPNGVPGFLEHVTVRGLTIIRSVPPQARPVTDPGQGFFTSPAGVRIQYVVTCTFQDINAIQHSNGFYLQGVVHSFLIFCQALRTAVGPSRDNDFFNGFFQLNALDIGYASGNASLYYKNCSAFIDNGLDLAKSSGIYTYGGFTDTFINAFECAFLEVGLNMNGAGSTAASYSSEDLVIDSCILDTCSIGGIVINAGNDGTAVTIHNCYVEVRGSGVAMDVKQTAGSVSIVGCQIQSAPGDAATGISVRDAGGVVSDANIVTDVRRPIAYDNARDCRCGDTINNVRDGAPDGALVIARSSRCVFRPIVKGRTGVTRAGVVFAGAANTLNEIDCTGIDSTCLQGGAASKLVCDGVQVTAPGPFGDKNLAVGIFA